MEQNNTAIFENNGLDETAKAHLLETTRWTKFLAIMGFIFSGLLLAGALAMLAAGSYLTSSSSGLGIGMAFYYVVLAGIYIYPVICLFRFSRLMKEGIHSHNQEMITEAFRYQKNMYRFMGILMIIFLSLGLLAIVFGGLSAIIAGN